MSGVFGNYYYYRVMRKIIVAFGDLFKDLTIVRYNKAGTLELERINVPLMYGQKEKYIERINSDPDLTKSVQVLLPRLSFEAGSPVYDPNRKLQSLISNYAVNPATNASLYKQYMSVPYDIPFTLSAYTRTIEDGYQIMEQILPIFNPQYFLPIEFDSLMNITKQVPFILDSVTSTIDEEGDGETIRYITWDYTFTAKANFFGPTSNAALILKANTDIFDASTAYGGHVVLNLNAGGTGEFKEGEIVFQGPNIDSATVKAEVIDFDSLNFKLYVKNVQGDKNWALSDIKGLETGADWVINNVYGAGILAVVGYSHPVPNTANKTDPWTVVTEIKEWPNVP